MSKDDKCLKLLTGGGRYQFSGRWQISSISPCIECSREEGNCHKYTQVGTIGKGSFGSVLLVKKMDTNNMLAMKVIDKETMLKKEQVRHTVQERRIMSSVSFPFLVRLVSHFQTRSSLYLVMELVRGGELFEHLRSVGKFQEEKARFYVREILVSLEYLHSLDLVYRDLKPENILLDEAGHVKITDFGFSTRMSPSTPRWTLCGTPEYLAPEVILGHGHGVGVDWWALGILVYEMCAGVPPFSSRKEEGEERQLEIYEQIISNTISFPDFFSRQLVDLITRLLCSYEENRLGVLDSVRDHMWLRDTDWSMVVRKLINAPYIPGDRSQGWVTGEENFERGEEILNLGDDDPFKDF